MNLNFFSARIMYNSFIPYNMVNQYLKFLIENGSLEYYRSNKTYRIIE
jgi:predicted transcriptional regulator